MKIYFLLRRCGHKLIPVAKSPSYSFVCDAMLKWVDAGYHYDSFRIISCGIDTKQCKSLTQKYFARLGVQVEVKP